MSIFRPNEIIDRFNKFDIKAHRDKGFNTILLDIDNTIDLPDNPNIGSKEAYNFIDELKVNGFKIIIVSNNTKERVQRFINGLDLDYKYWSFKPLPFVYKRIIKKYNIDVNKTISLGDQLLTDCLGANLNGIYTVYTKQLIEKDIIKTKINRFLERLIFKYILHEKV